MSHAPPTANPTSKYNHAVRRITAPSEYQPTTRMLRKIMEDINRRAYWCHLCCSSSLVSEGSKGLELHYEQAHPTQVRDASSNRPTTYADSRHGGPREQDRAGARPIAQLRTAKSSHASVTAVDLIPVPPPQEASGYYTVKDLDRTSKRRATRNTLEPPAHKRGRLSSFTSQGVEYSVSGRDKRGDPDDIASEDGIDDESEDGSIPHSSPSIGIRDGMTMKDASEFIPELSPSARLELEVGAACEGREQVYDFYRGTDEYGGVDDDVDAAETSEMRSNRARLCAVEMLVGRMLVKQTDLRDLMVEVMEAVRGVDGAQG